MMKIERVRMGAGLGSLGGVGKRTREFDAARDFNEMKRSNLVIEDK